MLVKNYSETQAATCVACAMSREACEDMCFNKIVYETYELETAEEVCYDMSQTYYKHIIIVGEPDIEVYRFMLSEDETTVTFVDEAGRTLLEITDGDFEVMVEAYCNAVGPEFTPWPEFFEKYHIRQDGREVVVWCGTER